MPPKKKPQKFSQESEDSTIQEDIKPNVSQKSTATSKKDRPSLNDTDFPSFGHSEFDPSILPPEESENDSDDESLKLDDPVVKRIPVFSHSKLSRYLFLLQYPGIPKEKHFSPATGNMPLSARYKPQNKVIEVDVPIRTDLHYDRVRGQEMALNAARPGSSSIPGDYIDRQTLSGVIQTDGPNYMAGYLNDGALYLSPINGVCQIRPTFRHIDAMEQRKAAMKREENEEQNSTQNRPPPTLRTYQVSVKRDLDEDAQQSKGSSLQNAKRQLEDEEWQRLSWKDSQTDESRTLKSYFIPDDSQKKLLVNKETMANYFDMLSVEHAEV